jgi:hypothetical protein
MAWVNLPGVIVMYFHIDLPSILRSVGEKILRFTTFILAATDRKLYVVQNLYY